MEAPAFQFYPGDFILSTSHMTSDEVGGYMRLLCHQWANNGLPNNLKKIEGIARLSGEALDTVLEKFHLYPDGKLKNNRLEKVRVEQNEYRAKKSKAGKAGAEAKYSKPVANASDCYTSAKVLPVANDKQTGSPSSSPSTSNISDNTPLAASKDAEKDAAFLDLFNRLTNRKFRALDAKAKRQFNGLRKAGFKYFDFEAAIKNGFEDSDTWPDSKKNHFTPEYITREAIFTKYLNWKTVPAKPTETKPISVESKKELDDLFGGANPNFKPKAQAA